MNRREVITFKADAELAELIRAIPNRSDFIRQAVLQAVGNVCPVCGGNGILTPSQKQHWKNFSMSHHLEQCEDCREYVLVCDAAVTEE